MLRLLPGIFDIVPYLCQMKKLVGPLVGRKRGTDAGNILEAVFNNGGINVRFVHGDDGTKDCRNLMFAIGD